MFDIVILGIIVISVLVAFIQARRGGMRSLVSLGLALLLAILAFVLAQPIAKGILSADISSMGLKLADQTVAASLNDYILDMISSDATVKSVLESSPALLSLVKQAPAALISVVLFVLLYFILRPLKWILYLIICRFVAPKRDENGEKIKKNYWAGFGICCARMLVTLSVLLVLVVGIFGLASSVADIMRNVETEVADTDIDEDAISVYDIVDDYKSSVTYTVISAVKLDSAYQAAFNGLSAIKLEDGSKTTLFGEVNKLLPVVEEVVKLSGIDTENLSSDDLGIISNMIKNLGESDLVGEILANVIKDTADAVLNKNEDRFGINLEEMKPADKELMSDVLGAFLNSTTEDVKEDIVVLGGCIDVLKDSGIIEAVMGSGEEPDISKILGAIAGDKEDGTKNPVIENLFAELNKSDRLGKLTGSIANYGLYQGNAAIGIPYDKTEVRDNMITDVSDALNNNNITKLDMDKVYAEIKAQAQPAEVPVNEIALRFSAPIFGKKLAQVNLLGDDAKSDYDRFMDALLNIIAAVDNSGVKYEGDGSVITYTIFSTTYQYNTKEERWQTATDDVQPTVVAVLAQKIIETAKETNTAEFTKEEVTEVLTTVSEDEELASIPEVKTVAEKLADETKFKTEKVTFKDNIAIDTSNYSKDDAEELASAMTDLIGLAQKVVDAMPKDDESGDVVSSLLDGDTLKEVGAVLDKLNNIGSTPENFSSSILQGVVDQMGNDEANKPIKDTLNSVIDGVKDPNKDVNYEDILGGVGDTSSGILSLLDYVSKKDSGDAPDKNVVIEKLAKSFESIKNMKPDALNLLKDSLLDNIKSMMPSNSQDVAALLTALVDKIADFDTPEGHDYKVDAGAVIELYEYLTAGREDTTSDNIINAIINKIKDSDILAFVSTDILQDFAGALLEHGGEANYLGMVIHKEDMFTADYIKNGVAKSMGDKFVAELFTVMKSDAFVNDPKGNLNIVAEILDIFVSANGKSLADCIQNAKKSGTKLPNVAGTAFEGLAAIYGA